MSADLAPAFISYSREDLDFALRLAQDLKAAGASVWLDKLDIKAGVPWDNAVEAALSQAPQMILILSPTSAKSNNVRDEISFALHRGRTILPVLYKDCDLPLRLHRVQRIDFRTNYAQGLVSLLQHLEGGYAIPESAVDKPVSRRGVLIGGAAAAVIAGGTWVGWPKLSSWMHPLPKKRFVALLAWPAGDSVSILGTVLRAIGDRLARAESQVSDLLIIAATDLPDSSSQIAPAQAASTLGVNLILAASLKNASSAATLTLQVLDAASQKVLRETILTRPVAELSTLAEAGPDAASKLLELPDRGASLKDEEELQHVSPQVFQLFSDAEALAAQPNNTGLQAAILKYQQAVDANTHFALGFARLAMAYVAQFLSTNAPAALTLAARNANLALRFNPDSAKALLSQAQVALYSGKPDEAFRYFGKCLQVDPGNPDTQLYQAQAYRSVNHLAEAQQVYHDILQVRPNYWPAYNELGFVLSSQGKYKEAMDAFESAAAVAEKVALPLANLGSLYLKLGKHDEAITACTESLKRSPNVAAYMTLGDIAFGDGKYPAALDDYQKAAVLMPKDHEIWRDIGDCYQLLGDPARVKENYTKAAELVATDLKRLPQSTFLWATSAFYHAKIGDAAAANADLKKVGAINKLDVPSQLLIAQAYALLGRKEDSLHLVLACMDQGLTPIDVELSPDLKEIQKDARYIERVHTLQTNNRAKAS